jgi:spore photoproduct lyase
MGIDKVYVDESVAEAPVTIKALERMGRMPEYVGKRELLELFATKDDPISDGKKTLFFTKGHSFIKPCPGTERYLCCGYYTLNIITGCPADCSYCILQAYLSNNPFIQVFVNIEDMLSELERVRFCRIGTGELADSLALEDILCTSEILIPFFAQKKKGFLELKTKMADIEHILSLRHNNHTIISWSVNSEGVIESEERGVAPLEKRIESAKACEEAGYRLSFHFDPLIYYDGWKKGYEEAVELILSSVNPRKIAWISLGSLRFMPELKAIIEERFPESAITYGELITGLDGKYRYFKPIRIELYRKLVSEIRRWSPDIFVYLCMESQDVWQKTLGFSPKNNLELGHLLDERARWLE